MARTDHFIVGITTPKADDDDFSQLVSTKNPDGTLFYNVITMGEPCEDCAASQKPWICTHKQHEIASWKDPVRMGKWQKPYETANRMSDLMQESFSIGGKKDKLVFNSKLVEALENRPKIPINSQVNALYMAIDPAGGGSGSQMAITVMAQYKSLFVVSFFLRDFFIFFFSLCYMRVYVCVCVRVLHFWWHEFVLFCGTVHFGYHVFCGLRHPHIGTRNSKRCKCFLGVRGCDWSLEQTLQWQAYPIGKRSRLFF